jgi:hypothetical protein
MKKRAQILQFVDCFSYQIGFGMRTSETIIMQTAATETHWEKMVEIRKY